MFPTPNHITQTLANLEGDLRIFLPELALCFGIVLLLLCRLVKAFDRSHLGVVAAVVAGVATLLAGFQFIETMELQPVAFFSGMLVTDPFANAVRAMLLTATLLTILLTLMTGIPDRDDSGDFYALLLGGTLGMMLMTSVNHLMMAFIAVEMASLPSYALSGFLKGKRLGSEAALKYVVFGAGSSGVMLYGISLLAGTFGTGHLTNVASAIAVRLGEAGGLDPLALTGLALLFVGLGFKLSAFPFHFWCPDVFEGAAAEVAGFLSVASKTAAVALTVRILQTLQLGAENMIPSTTAHFVLPNTVGVAVGVFGAITVTFGNLAAFGQNNLKRMLAYSTIAHAGYMLLGVAVMTAASTASVLYYLFAYLFMNLGAFAVVAFVRNKTGSEEITAFRGLIWKSPVLAVTMSLFFFSLLGFPPLAGFAGKFQVFESVYEGGRSATDAGFTRLGTAYYVLLGVGAVNTAISAYYYLRVVRAMLLEEDPAPQMSCSVCAGGTIYLSFLAAMLFVAGIVWNPITQATDRAAATFTPLKVRDPIQDVGPAPKGVAPPAANIPGKGGGPKGGNPKGGGPKGGNPKKGPPA
jgi:NADH-quinone oxidoreductase subunit N